MVDFVGEEKAVGLLDAPVEAFKAALYTGSVEKEHYIPEVSRKNEGFLTSGQVNYVCRAGNFRKSGLKYTGALRVLKVMLAVSNPVMIFVSKFRFFITLSVLRTAS